MSFRDRVKELRRVRAGDLEPHPLNWRLHDDDQRAALEGVLEDVGFAGAVIVREHNGGYQIIDGHLRSGMDPDAEVPVLVTDLDAAEAEKLLATYDPIGAMSGTDTENLRALLDSIQTDNENVQALLKHVEFEARLNGSPKEEGPEPLRPPITPNAKLGDLYALGGHRLLCGDATDEGCVTRLLNGAVPNLMVTDPPYGVNYDPAWRAEAAANGHLAYAARRVGNVPNDDRSDWGPAFKLFPGNVIYCWSPAGSNSVTFYEALFEALFEVRMQIIWSKPHFPISRGHYHVRHEPCWYAVRKGKDAAWIGDRTQTTVWEIPLDRNDEGGHGAQKPVECMACPIRNHAGDVYDPFVGSGTTLIACEQTDRTCYAMDVDPGYCDVAIARWERYTGHAAELLERVDA